jgi:RNA polymerase sigma-70 factor (ECF subfamily)
VTESDFEELYCALAPRLRRYLGRLCDSDAAAEEMVQETFFRFLRAKFDGSGEERVRYLFTIATNLARNHWSRTRRTEPLDETHIYTPDRNARIDLIVALSTLAPRERALLWLAYAEGYDHREIARIMDVGRASVRVLLFRAKRKLRNLLETNS